MQPSAWAGRPWQARQRFSGASREIVPIPPHVSPRPDPLERFGERDLVARRAAQAEHQQRHPTATEVDTQRTVAAMLSAVASEHPKWFWSEVGDFCCHDLEHQTTVVVAEFKTESERCAFLEQFAGADCD